jgi:hypothetical protein
MLLVNCAPLYIARFDPDVKTRNLFPAPAPSMRVRFDPGVDGHANAIKTVHGCDRVKDRCKKSSVPSNERTFRPLRVEAAVVGRDALVACSKSAALPSVPLFAQRPTVVVASVLPVSAANSVLASLASHHPTHPLISSGELTAVTGPASVV